MALDSAIVAIDQALRTLFGSKVRVGRAPGAELPEPSLSLGDKRHAGALMRVNHVGEVCAQALYQGQAVVCHDPLIRASLDRAASEEVEHLEWTAQRIRELDSRASLLNPFWYFGAFAIGVLAGKCGDHWSLGFLAETERQVGRISMGICGYCQSRMQSRERLCAKCETMKSRMPKWPWPSGGGNFRCLLVP